MFKIRILLPALLLAAAVPAVSQAQISLPLTTTTYEVQVEYEFWRSGGTYWSTVFETEDQDAAELMYDLLLVAFENGEICDLLGCSFDWIISDVRLISKTVLNLQINDQRYRPADYQYQSPFLQSPTSRK